MNPDKINIAIAESLGYKPEQDESGHWDLTHPTRSFTKKGWWCRDYAFRDAPNYYYSLDACAEFEAKLDSCCPDERSLWMDHLALACGWPEGLSHSETLFESHYRSIRATAPKRCEAYIRTIGKPEALE